MLLICATLLAVPTTDPDALPRSLADAWAEMESAEMQEAKKDKLTWTAGLRLGYARGFDADEGGFLLGGQGRLYLKPWLAFEAVLEQHREEYADGDAEVRYIPLEASVLLYPFGDGMLRPYGLAGVGIHTIRADYSGALAAVEDEDWRRFGIQLGAGLDLPLGDRFLLTADLRFHFIDEPGDFDDDALDFWEFGIGISYVIN